MLGSVQGKWIVWTRAATICVAVLAILASGLAIPPDIDHDDLPARLAAASVVDADFTDEDPADPVADADCHVGPGCVSVILPGGALDMARFENAPDAPRVPGYLASGAGYPPFHPPRILSQI